MFSPPLLWSKGPISVEAATETPNECHFSKLDSGRKSPIFRKMALDELVERGLAVKGRQFEDCGLIAESP
jgi:hypothetical protein